MANLSNATGSLKIKAPNQNTLRKVMYLINEILEDCDYYTNMYDFTDSEEYFKENIIDYDIEYSITVPFEGVGRWSYLTNIEKMGDWIVDYLEYGDDKSAKQYIADLYAEEFSICFEYFDYEVGCEIFDDYVVEFVHTKDSKIRDAKVSVISQESIEKTVVNYCKKLDWSFDESMEELLLIYDKVSVKNKLIEERYEIEDYFNKSLEDLTLPFICF